MYLIYWNETLVAMASVLPIPSGTIKKAFRQHRLVVLPDFQGLGIGTKINEFIANLYISSGKKYYIRTTHLRLINHMRDNELWCETSSSNKVSSKNGGDMNFNYDTKRICGSFEFMGEKYAYKPHKEVVIDKVLDFEKIKALLEQYVNDYYITVIHGVASEDDLLDELCMKMGIRTEILYMKSKGEFIMKSKYKNKAIDI